MSKKPETVFRERVMPHFEKIPNSWWESIQQKSIRFTPDVLACVNGHFVALEFKTDEGDAMLGQSRKAHLIKVKAKGYHAFVKPSNWKEVHSEISKLAHKSL